MNFTGIYVPLFDKNVVLFDYQDSFQYFSMASGLSISVLLVHHWVLVSDSSFWYGYDFWNVKEEMCFSK